MSRDTPDTVRQREQRLRLQIDQTIQQLQSQQQESNVEVFLPEESRHRDPLSEKDRGDFEPDVKTVDANRKLAQQKEAELAKAVDRSLRKLEDKNLSPTQQRVGSPGTELEFAL